MISLAKQAPPPSTTLLIRAHSPLHDHCPATAQLSLPSIRIRSTTRFLLSHHYSTPADLWWWPIRGTFRVHICVSIDRSGIYRMIARNEQQSKKQSTADSEHSNRAWIGFNKWSNNYQLIWLSSGQWLPRDRASSECLDRRGENDKINFHDPLQELIAGWGSSATTRDGSAGNPRNHRSLLLNGFNGSNGCVRCVRMSTGQWMVLISDRAAAALSNESPSRTCLSRANDSIRVIQVSD